ncbi:ribosomal L7Ae/L30e/S12e/Gadd45 family protein [Oceanobacillus sp. CAU 1775]
MSYEKVTQLKSRIIIGAKQTQRAMESGLVSEVFIAEDANQQITQKVVNLASELDIPFQHVDSMLKLGKASGVKVKASVVAIKN